MKRFYIVALLAAFVLSSCVEELQRFESVSLNASIECQLLSCSESKSTLSGLETVWTAGDRVSVLTEGNNAEFKLSSGAGTSSCIFDGAIEEASVYFALYPYSATALYSKASEAILFSLPATQTYSESSFGNGASPAVAVFNAIAQPLTFKNICGVLRISLRGTGNVSNIVVEDASGARLWGNFSLSTAGIGTASQTLTYLSGGGSSISLECGNVPLGKADKDFNIVVPPGSFAHGFTATVNLVGGESVVFATSADQTVSRSRIHPMEGKGINAQATFDLENPVVASYLDYLEAHPYTDGDYTYTYVNDYYNVSTTYRKDRPMPALVCWTPDENSVSQKVYVSESSDFTSSLSWDVSNDACAYEIYNLIPGRHYYWKTVSTLSDSSQKVLESSSFNTIGRRRFLAIDKVCNVRDLGGIPTADGTKQIRYGFIFRSGEMNGNHTDYDGVYCRISAEGIAAFRQAGVAADLDLRRASEAQSITSSPLGSDVQYRRFNDAVSYYYDGFWNTDIYISAVQWVIDNLRAGRPVDFHCIYGADRTGTLGFLLEALLGVSENQMSIDYEMTSFSYGLNYPPRRRGPSNVNTNYKYREMLEGVLDTESTVFTGSTVQARIYNFLNVGVGETSISSQDLDWFIDFMLESI